MTNLAVHHNSDNQCWQTPDEVLDIVRQVGPIGLDPCTVDSNPTRAARIYTPEQNGLSRSWDVGRGAIVFMNPPYSKECAEWVSKAIEEASAGVPIVTLTTARPDTRWCQALLSSCDAACFWRGRIRFRGAPHPAPFPSLFAGFNVGSRFTRAFAPHGLIARMEQAALPGVA